jgi:hypothetical protein
MFSWWLGRGTQGTHGTGTALDHAVIPFTNVTPSDNVNAEPPETPAPVFAARALKSALFGTPAFADETILETEKGPGSRKTSIAISTNTKEIFLEPDETLDNMSPVKRGILMTPGTATTRRKSVSFGSEAMEKKEGVVGCKALAKKRDDTPFASKTIDTDFDIASGDESPSKQRSARRNRSTSLTKSLEGARGRQSSKGKSDRTSSVKRSREESTARNSKYTVPTSKTSLSEERIPGYYDETEQDMTQVLDFTSKSLEQMTIDFENPLSESGNFWRTKYNAYHKEALAEMNHVLRYKDLAKSFARKKDSQAAELAEKLRTEQSKVNRMENMIIKLSKDLGSGDTEDSLENIKEVAKLRAIVADYKARVEDFRLVLEEPVGTRKLSKDIAAQSAVVDKDTEPSPMREELSQVRKSLYAAEKKIVKLEADNARLAQELKTSDLHLLKQRERNQKLQQSHQDEARRKDEILAGLRREYNELMELKRDSEELLKKRQDQVTALKQEITTLKNVNETAAEYHNGNFKHTLSKESANGHRSPSQIASILGQRATAEEKPLHNRPIFLAKSHSYAEDSPKRKSHIPFSNQPILRPSNESAVTGSRSPSPRTTAQGPLAEIVNNASTQKVEGRPLSTVQYSPMATHFSDLAFGELTSGLPPLEPSYAKSTSRKVHDKTCRENPGPSIFNIPSSPPKSINQEPRAYHETARQTSNPEFSKQESFSMSPSRLPIAENPRVRKEIPPERAAAAKARLEQKAADKRRSQAAGI